MISIQGKIRTEKMKIDFFKGVGIHNLLIGIEEKGF
jgi:hypothetical protein